MCTTFLLLFIEHSHLPNCIWNRINASRGECKDRFRFRSNLKWCRRDRDCSSDEICASFNFAPDPCISNGIGQCITQPMECPSTTDEEVCGCDGRDYEHACECLKEGRNVKYEGACSSARDREFRRYVRDLDNGEFTEEYFWQYMLGSVTTDGETCLTELECYKQRRVTNDEDDFTFRVISDQSNCGCFEHNGKSYWSDHNRCSDQEKMSDDLNGSRERTHCDLNSIYRNVRNVPVDTCLTVAGCDEQCDNDGRNGVHIKTNPNSNKCGCYTQENQCYWNSCGNNIDKASANLPNDYNRVWCGDRTRDARDLVFDTCLTQQDCEDKAELDGDVRTPAIIKNFNSDNICGCYKKGGNLYWATCGLNGDFYGELNNQKRRVHCHDVQNRSYRVFDRSHSHFVSAASILYSKLSERWHDARLFWVLCPNRSIAPLSSHISTALASSWHWRSLLLLRWPDLSIGTTASGDEYHSQELDSIVTRPCQQRLVL